MLLSDGVIDPMRGRPRPLGRGLPRIGSKSPITPIICPGPLSPMLSIAMQTEIIFTGIVQVVSYSASLSEGVALAKQDTVTAHIMNILSYILPCCCKGSAEIELNQQIYYIPRTAIRNAFNCHTDRPCNHQTGADNTRALKVVAKRYFLQKEAEGT